MAPERNDNASLQEREHLNEEGAQHNRTTSCVKHESKRSVTADNGRSSRRGLQHRSEKGNWAASDDVRLADLFLAALKDIYAAEKQMLHVMWRIGRQIRPDQLRQVLEMHGEETEIQVERLEQVFEMLNKPPTGKSCKTIEGLISDLKAFVEKSEGSDALDARLISAVRAIEYYEISSYRRLKTWAEELRIKDAVKLLEESLQEEKRADALLTKIAAERINQSAA